MVEYWVISPYDSRIPKMFDIAWEFDKERGTIALGWPNVEDISDMSSDEIRKRLDDVYEFPNESCLTKDANALWSFYNELSVGDIVIARRGTKIIIGIGRVTREAFYDEKQGNERTKKHGGAMFPHFIEVEWELVEKRFSKIIFSPYTIYKLPNGKSKFRKLTKNINFEIIDPFEDEFQKHIPSQSEIVPRFLKILEETDLLFHQVLQILIDEFNLSEKDLDIRMPSGKKSFNHRVHWSLYHLRRARLVEDTDEDKLRITSDGRKAVNVKEFYKGEAVNWAYLRAIPGYRGKRTGTQKPKQHQMIREAMESTEGIISREFILDFIGSKYPETNLKSIKIVIKAFTVNNHNRIGSFPENQRARIYDTRYDILYQPTIGKDEYELFDPKIHGYWPIVNTGTSDNEFGLEVRDEGTSLPKPEVSRKKSKGKERPAPPEGTLERMEYDTIGSSFIRNQDVVDWVKAIEDSKCQICGYTIEAPDGSTSIDLHHIWPLGKPHRGYEKGYDRVENAICLCPNHHREMHMGLFYIETDTYRIVYYDKTRKFNNQLLKRHSEHDLDELFLAYHRSKIFRRKLKS